MFTINILLFLFFSAIISDDMIQFFSFAIPVHSAFSLSYHLPFLFQLNKTKTTILVFKTLQQDYAKK